MKDRQEFAQYMDSQSYKLGINTDEFRSYVASQSRERWEHATLASSYKDEILENPHRPILLALIPPLAIYLALLGLAMIAGWVRRGFSGR